ncbi:nucleoside phosphorylase domain-containing protein [Aspergillus carlsbadensis]|nr:nucleoside phosphorylase domain-containing protein [Aspergillus carlsbadensis]
MTDSYSNKASDYTVGIICALDKEHLAVRCLLDSLHPVPYIPRHDTNSYTLGSIAHHAVVTTCLPAGEYGTNAAASVAAQMRISFPAIEFCLMVGIAGGIPGKEDIRLGDVVVSLPTGAYPGVLQHDMRKAMPDCFIATGSLQRPPRVLLSAINSLRSNPHFTANPLQQYVDTITRDRPLYRFPGRENDVLFGPDCIHSDSETNCLGHLNSQLRRAARESDHPRIHYGLVASGNTVIKDAALRDRLAETYQILCFEMEAAGILNVLPSLVIRGICDYCDSHKSKVWQQYAAATAAAYAKVLLREVRAHRVRPDMQDDMQHTRVEETPYDISNAARRLIPVPVTPDDVPPSVPIPQSVPLRPRRPADILRKAESFAERRALWNTVPDDVAPFIEAFKNWAETSSSCTLVLAPQGPSAEPRAEDFAFEAISLLKSQGQPVIWALRPPFSEQPLSGEDILHCLVQQLRLPHCGSRTEDTLTETQPITPNTLPIAFDDLGRFFAVLAVKHLHFISFLLGALGATRGRPGQCVKILLVSYSDEMSNLAALYPHTMIHRLLPPQPKPKRMRAVDPWRDTVRATI